MYGNDSTLYLTNNKIMQLEINGKVVGTKFNNYAIFKIPSVKGDNQLSNLTAIVWGGYLGWCYAKQTEPELSFEEVSDWIDAGLYDESIGKQIEAVSNEMAESQQYINFIKKYAADNENGEKKSMSGTTSINTHSGL